MDQRGNHAAWIAALQPGMRLTIGKEDVVMIKKTSHSRWLYKIGHLKVPGCVRINNKFGYVEYIHRGGNKGIYPLFSTDPQELVPIPQSSPPPSAAEHPSSSPPAS